MHNPIAYGKFVNFESNMVDIFLQQRTHKIYTKRLKLCEHICNVSKHKPKIAPQNKVKNV